MSGWQKYTFEDVCRKIYSGGTPSTKHAEYWNGTINWLSSGETGNRFIYDTERKITELGVKKSATKKAYKGNTVVASAGQGYTRGQASYLTIDTYVNQSVIVFDANTDIIDSKFLFYNLSSRYEELRQLSDGTSTRGGISGWIVKRMEINLPPLDVQKQIVTILSAIDDKIELNTAINQNLEQQVQAIFENLIISATNGVKNGMIGDYCSVKSGYAFKSSWWLSDGIQVIKIKNIDNGVLNFSECSCVSSDKLTIAKDFLVIGGDVLIAMTGATIGKFAVVPKYNKPLLVNQRVGKFFLGDNPVEKLPFLFCTLKLADVITEIINRGQGSAQPNVSTTDIMTTPCYLPNSETILSFNKICRPLFESIINRQYENQRLAALHDTLLPKLMNGEIDVSAVKV